MDTQLVAPTLSSLRERRSVKWRKFPADVLPLFVAEMDYNLAPPVAEALHAAITASDTGYSAAAPDLGSAFSGFADRRWGWSVDPERVHAVTDVGVGIVELLRLLCRPGDVVAISPPVYPPFFDWPAEAGARLLEVPLRDGRLDLEALERAFATHPAAYILCNPQNPVGLVHTADELAALIRLAKLHRVTVVSDEIHAPVVMAGATHTPLLTLPGAAETSVSIVSASKAFNLAGLKCAAVVTVSERMHGLVARFPPDAVWRTGHLGALASVAAWTEGDEWLRALLRTLEARRTELGALLANHLPSLRWTPPSATYLAWLDCTAIGADDVPRDLFLSRARVALEPGTRFGAAGSGFVRLNFATSSDILTTALTRMAAALS
jgi:cystathionine beta-lyase